MRKLIVCIAAASAFCFGSGLSAAQAQETQNPAPDEAEETDDQIIVEGQIEEEEIERCRVVRVTGTRFSERICMSQREVEEQRENNRDMMNDHRYDGPGPVEDHPTQPGPAVPPI